ncbi:DUF2493 domain-containing protein [Kiloniella sp.]|uniref:DUF2493 domain-containing protein n=1 Tax=Kiloniella sp. TaxID=1938587 RepID=UPI003B02988B
MEHQNIASKGLTSTARVIEEMETFGRRPFCDEEDHRPLPDSELVTNALDEVFGILTEIFTDTRLEDQLSSVLSDVVNSFNRRVSDVERKLDGTEYQLKDLQRHFDGSEITTLKLERLTAEGRTMTEARDAFEVIRDIAADQFEMIVGKAWMPRTRKSVVNHSARSQAFIGSNDFIKARKLEKTLVHIPKGTPVLFSGDYKVDDINGVCLMLDRLADKTPDMFLVTTAGNKGADIIAASWAKSKKVPVVAFGIHSKAKKAPFDRNREIFKQVKPSLAIIFGSGGIQENLRELSKKNRIKAFDGFKLVEAAKSK